MHCNRKVALKIRLSLGKEQTVLYAAVQILAWIFLFGAVEIARIC